MTAMRCGPPIHSVVSTLPFGACVIQGPTLHIAGVQNIVAECLMSGVPIFIAVEAANVKATFVAPKIIIEEDMYECDGSMYVLSLNTALYTSGTHVLSVCSSAPLEKPRYNAYCEGRMSFLMHVDIFSYPLNLVLIPSAIGNWIVLGNFVCAFGEHNFYNSCNAVFAVLAEKLFVPDEFVQSRRAFVGATGSGALTRGRCCFFSLVW